jgi:uncharacterized protein (TIGR02270 family)
MERPLAYPRVYLDIVEEHFQELDFLWELRERSLFRPGLFLKDLARIEDRARSHLNGLIVGELHAVDLCRPHLSGGDTAAATAAALVFLAFNSTELDDEVLAAFEGGPPKAREGIRIALRQSDGARIGPRLAEIATSPDPGVRAASADLLAFHRLPPPKGLDALFFDDAPHVRVLTCGAIGRFGGPWGGDYLEHALKSANADVRRAALEASARLGMPGIDRYCRSAALRADVSPDQAIEFLGVLGDPVDLGFLQNLILSKPQAIAAIRGLGAMGRLESVPVLIAQMTNPAVAHEAGAAFARITGATGIDADAPLPPLPGVSAIDADFLDGERPPDAKKAEAWWAKERGRFDPATAWQMGVRISPTPTQADLDAQPLNLRRDLFLRACAQGRNIAVGFEPERHGNQVVFRS